MTGVEPQPVVVRSLDDLLARRGELLGPGTAVSVDQDKIDGFAHITGDHQWIHVDAERARQGVFGTTVAHGYLTLSLLPQLARNLVRFDGFAGILNYGIDRARFPAPVRAGARLRAQAEVQSAEATPRGIRTVIRYTIRNDDTGDTACVADTVTLLVQDPR